eukprot:CAMPEP_0167757386 /NCGR_PEP_ID=MMETSP0110_2-20121227/9895_1 /TAXON_ID=629695 /ORGANISM="Gymnochlora sp., Strain CCMP2014" /LENGTH=333 /DNA_ID=CAMNT_0007643567 /DNA_START=47 /DNA_END=1048 /DNA_ORIENTATION=-
MALFSILLNSMRTQTTQQLAHGVTRARVQPLLTTVMGPRPSLRRRMTVKAKEEDPGHKDNRPRREPTEQEMRIMQYQQNAPKLSFAEEAKSLVSYSNGYGVISTVAPDGYPGGAVVMFAPDEKGLPTFFFSTMSSHTQDLLKGTKASITIKTTDFKGASDARVNLVGDIEQVTSDEEKKALKESFLKKHPGAFWVEFGDFLCFSMKELKAVRYVGGFARAASIGAADYIGAEPDPIMAFADKIAGHMNEDHEDATKAIVEHEMGLECETAQIKTVDRLGMTVFVTAKQPDGSVSSPFKLRIGFPEEAADRPAVRNILKDMTMAAVAAKQPASS